MIFIRFNFLYVYTCLIKSLVLITSISIIYIVAGNLPVIYIQSIGSSVSDYSSIFFSFNLDNSSYLLLPIISTSDTKKSLTTRAWIGIKEGMAIQVLPDHILKFDNNMFVRIFKLLGALSSYIVVTGLTDKLS